MEYTRYRSKTSCLLDTNRDTFPHKIRVKLHKPQKMARLLVNRPLKTLGIWKHTVERLKQIIIEVLRLETAELKRI